MPVPPWVASAWATVTALVTAPVRRVVPSVAPAALALAALCPAAAAAPPPAALVAFQNDVKATDVSFTSELPPITGNGLAMVASYLGDDASRQRLVADELLAGHHPTSQFAWHRVSWTGDDADGVPHDVRVDVAPDYLAVGTDDDFLYAPLGLPEAVRVADVLGFALPTPLVVDRVYEAAEHHFEPRPLPPTRDMRLPYYWLKARRLISGLMEQPRTALLAGHKKDVVLSQRLQVQPSQLAIYGWHRAEGDPIQPICTIHGRDYADYSHGIRPVSPTVYVDGEPMAYAEVLADPVLHALLSDEGPVDVARILRNARR